LSASAKAFFSCKVHRGCERRPSQEARF
jgi:hypothetical protein